MDARKSDAESSSECLNGALQTDLDVNGSQLDELLRENRQLRKRCALAIKQSEEVNKDFVNEKCRSSSLEDEIRKLNEHNHVNSGENDKLHLENSDLKSALTELEDKMEELRKERIETIALQEELVELKKEKCVREEAIEELCARVARVFTGHVNAVSKLSKDENETLTLQEELGGLRVDGGVKDDKIEELCTGISRIARTLTNYRKTLEDLAKEKDEKRALQETLGGLKEVNRVKDKKIEELYAKSLLITTSSEDLHNSVKRLVKEKQVLVERLDGLKKQRHLMEENTEKLVDENLRLTRALTDQQEIVEDSSRERNEKHTLQQVLEGLKKVNCMKDEKIESLTNENSRITRDLADHQNTVDMLQKAQEQKRTLRQELCGLQMEICLREEEAKNLQAEIARITRVLTDHQSTTEDLRRERNEKRTLQEILGGLKNVNRMKDEQIEHLHAENSRITSVLSDRQNTIEMLRKELQQKRAGV